MQMQIRIPIALPLSPLSTRRRLFCSAPPVSIYLAYPPTYVMLLLAYFNPAGLPLLS